MKRRTRYSVKSTRVMLATMDLYKAVIAYDWKQEMLVTGEGDERPLSMDQIIHVFCIDNRVPLWTLCEYVINWAMTEPVSPLDSVNEEGDASFYERYKFKYAVDPSYYERRHEVLLHVVDKVYEMALEAMSANFIRE